MAQNFQELRTNVKVKETKKGKNFRKFDGGKNFIKTGVSLPLLKLTIYH